ncbi:MAG: hypothetical protein EOM05_09660 [Clostridia bacterium]|nr:hypothetical protein [Clostridia bacterium]
MTLLDNRSAQKPVIASVLIENSPLPENILDEVNSSNYLSNGHKKQINKYQSGSNNRNLLEYQIADLNQEIKVIEGEIVNNAINNDSLPEARQLALDYFVSKPEKDVQDLITTYDLNLASNDFTEAQDNISELRQYSENLSITEADEINTFCDVSELYLTYIIDTLTSDILIDNKDFLFDAAQSISPLYSAMAEILYSYTSDSVFFEYTPLPYEVIAPRNISILPDIEEETTSIFEIYPNPTDDIIYVEYDFSVVYDDANIFYHQTLGIEQKNNCKYGKIIVYSNDAKALEEIPLESETGKLKINLSNYVPGQYLIEIIDCYGNQDAKKITKK